MSTEVTPIPAHMASEFYVWLWWCSEQRGGHFDLGGDVGPVVVWVDDRLAFRSPGDTKVTAVLTGENPSATLEARAALAGGKVLQDLRVGARRDEREFFATLKGPAVHVSALKLPQVLSENSEEQVYDRMFLYEEFGVILTGLLQQFADVRSSDAWGKETLPAIRQWLGPQLSSEG